MFYEPQIASFIVFEFLIIFVLLCLTTFFLLSCIFTVAITQRRYHFIYSVLIFVQLGVMVIPVVIMNWPVIMACSCWLATSRSYWAWNYNWTTCSLAVSITIPLQYKGTLLCSCLIQLLLFYTCYLSAGLFFWRWI